MPNASTRTRCCSAIWPLATYCFLRSCETRRYRLGRCRRRPGRAGDARQILFDLPDRQLRAGSDRASAAGGLFQVLGTVDFDTDRTHCPWAAHPLARDDRCCAVHLCHAGSRRHRLRSVTHRSQHVFARSRGDAGAAGHCLGFIGRAAPEVLFGRFPCDGSRIAAAVLGVYRHRAAAGYDNRHAWHRHAFAMGAPGFVPASPF